MSTISIAGFPSSDKVPGAYGETVFGAGAISAASIPITLLLAGMMDSGTATPDTQIVPVSSDTIANAAFGIRSQLARMCRIALLIPGINLSAIAITAPSGAAATCTFTVVGAASASGTYSFRLGGEAYSVAIGSGDSITTIAAAIASAVNNNSGGFSTAAGSVGVCTVTVSTLGAQGNQYIAFGDSTQLPSGTTVTLAGGSAVTGGGVFFTGGTGTENVTNALATLAPTLYDRIGIAQNDATNLGRWKTQLNTQASAVNGIRQHAVTASNGSLAAAQSLTQSTLNAYRFQLVWGLNEETHPSEVAAAMSALRTQQEQTDPDHAYDGDALIGVAPNQQKGDWPSHATLVSALNTGVTPLMWDASNALIARSIVTHSLSGSAPDYRTLDTSDAVVPDFVLLSLLLIWTTSFKPANPRVRDNPAPEEPAVADGIATPATWNRIVEAQLRAFERGDQLPFPIITNVSQNLPISSFDSTAKRIMSAVNVVPAANQHQIGISVRQVSQ